MRYLIFGAGAIGTYVGGSLALSGLPVVFLERPDTAALLRESGLRLDLGLDWESIPAPVIVEDFPSALQLGPFDASILAVKSFDTENFIAGLQPYLDQVPPVLDLQNGVENEQIVSKWLGPGRVIPGTVTTAIERVAPGSVRVQRLRGIGIASGHPLSQSLVSEMVEPGLNPQLIAQAESMKWSKMLTNLMANATSAILDMTPAEIYADPRLYRLELIQLREALQVMHARQIKVIDLPGTPVRLLAWVVQKVPARLSQPILQRVVGGGRGRKMPSFHIDLYSGRGQSEVTYLNGAVARYGASAGILAPVNKTLTDILSALTAGRLPRDTYAHQPEKLLAVFNL